MKVIVIESMYLYNYNKPEDGITVGGSQRYALDLGKMFHSNGYKVIYVTKAKSNSERSLDNWATIVAFDSPYGEKGRIDFSKRVYSYCKNIKPDIACYSDIEIGHPYCYENSFALQHGISWDNPNNSLKNKIKSFFYLKAVHKFKRIICVDTNFINWCRERDKEYFKNPSKLVYIPNYADENQFVYSYKEWSKNQSIKLLYPRRLVEHRGFSIFMNMCSQLINKGYNITPVLAFEDFKKEEFIKSYPQYKNINCEIVHPSLNEIQKYYYEAYLTFVPTKWSEGTSLSAIESISVGCPVIVSDVGGLGNIVLPGFNGYIVPPCVDEFVKITEKLLNNCEMRNKLSQNCKIMNEVFGKERWKSEVFNAIKDIN